MSTEKHHNLSCGESNNLERLREIIEKDDSFTGVGRRDVNWLLRDICVPRRNSEGTDENHLDSKPNNKEEVEKVGKGNDLGKPNDYNSISPVSMNNTRQRSQSLSQLSRLKTDSYSLEGITNGPHRRDSLPNIPTSKKESFGGFFSKLKGKFSKNKAPASDSRSLFNESYTMSNPDRRSISPQSESSGNSKLSPYNSNSSTIFSSSGTDFASVDNRIKNYINNFKSVDFNRSRSPSYTTRDSNFSSTNEHDACESENYSTDVNAEIKQLKSFLKRLYDGSLSSSQEGGNQSGDRIDKNKGHKEELHKLKRVGFHCLTLTYDPPQQLPSRRPRKGNVEVLPNGERVIHPLSKEDRMAIENDRVGKSGGAIIGGLSTAEDSEDEYYNEEGDVQIDERAKHLGIERPMMSHKDKYRAPEKKMQLDTMYERCCHLREILPLPSILKQIPRGTMDPIPLLQLRNPTPTMIEIDSFADFIRIAPILCLSFDGVELSVKQLEILLAAISAKRYLQKLSMRNTKINRDGWIVLCGFLSQNHHIKCLDITQVPNLHVGVSKNTTKKNSADDIKRMKCNSNDRSDMNWELFTAALVVRGGIDELVITGCRIRELAVFERFISRGILLKTSILGIANNDLTSLHISILAKNFLFLPFVRGLDLGFNNFSMKDIDEVLECVREYGPSKLKQSQLLYLSFNNTNIMFTKTFKNFFEGIIMALPMLKYLDLSNNPQLFNKDDSGTDDTVFAGERANFNFQNDVVKYFTSKFPLFANLCRLEIDYNGLSTSSIVQIANVLPYCEKLKYLSLVGNVLDLTSATALVIGLKNSRDLFLLDGDFDDLPALFKDKIRLYSFRNMERILFSEEMDNTNGISYRLAHDTNDLGSKIHNSLSKQLSDILSEKFKKGLNIDRSKVESFIERIKLLRQKLKEEMKKMSRALQKGDLTSDKKEVFLIYFFLDLSLQRGLELIDASLIDETLTEPSDFLKAKLSTEMDDDHVSKDISDDESIASQLLASEVSKEPSDSSLKDSISGWDKREGTVLKLLKLKDDFDPALDVELQEISGEEINNRILQVSMQDLDKTIEFLSRLRKEKYSYKQILEIIDDPTSDIDEAIKGTIELLYHGHSENQTDYKDTENVINHDENNKDQHVDKTYDETLEAAYDETLKHFNSQ